MDSNIGNSYESQTIDVYLNSDQNKGLDQELDQEFEDNMKPEINQIEEKQVFNRLEKCFIEENVLIVPKISENSIESQSDERQECEGMADKKTIEKKSHLDSIEEMSQSLSDLNILINKNSSETGSESRSETASLEFDHRFDAFGDCLDEKQIESKSDDKPVIESETDSNVNKEKTPKRVVEKKHSMNAMNEMRLSEKWGESVGVYDTNGSPKRLVSINELFNYFELKLTSLYSNDYQLYCSLINSRYPRFYTSTVNYYQRWRMRYNIFVDKVLATESCEPVVLHMGEIHLYFDVVPQYCQPVYVNSSFYPNKNTITDGSLDANVVQKIVNSIRYSKDIFQFKFPLNGDLFCKRNDLFHKFNERQIEFIEEAIKEFRKHEQKKRKFENWNHFNDCLNNGKELQTKQSMSEQEVAFEDSFHRSKQTHERYDKRIQSPSNRINNRANGREFGHFYDSESQRQPMKKTSHEEKNAFKMEWNDSFSKDEQKDVNHKHESSLRGKPFQRQSFRKQFSNNRANNNDFTQLDSIECEPNNAFNRYNNSKSYYSSARLHSNIDN